MLKIRTFRGRITTFISYKIDNTHITGVDKFGEPVKVPLSEVDKMDSISEANN